MKEQFNKLKNDALKAIAESKIMAELSEVYNRFLSKKGEVMALMANLRLLNEEDKKTFGQNINETKKVIESALKEKEAILSAAELSEKLKNEVIDLTLPGRTLKASPRHPFHLIKDEIEEIFLGMGYRIEEGSEVEEDHFNFTLLNMPEDHPARAMHDSFYFSKNTLLRTHTSPVQARVMQQHKNESLKMISPGKVYRRDDDDNTHSHQFGQIEGLVIDEGLSLGNLKATLDLFIKKMFGPTREIRFRSSYFPFTEPSVEVDVSCHECNGKGCATCKGTGWIEILGAGMVNPLVLSANGYDEKRFSGFAFGIGIERVAMLRYGIDDIRRFYQNDLRFLDEFPKR